VHFSEIPEQPGFNTLNQFAEYAPCGSINTPDKGQDFFLDNGRKYEFPCAETEKPVFISCHHPVNESRATPGVSHNENRLFELDFSPLREEYVVQEQADTIKELDQWINYEKCDQEKNPFCIKRHGKLFPFEKGKVDCAKEGAKIKIHSILPTI
jgi:hypothetical protein